MTNRKEPCEGSSERPVEHPSMMSARLVSAEIVETGESQHLNVWAGMGYNASEVRPTYSVRIEVAVTSRAEAEAVRCFIQKNIQR